MTRLVPISDIVVPDNRQRKLHDPERHVELCDSIQNPGVGLLHPIVLRRNGGGDAPYALVAGERRLRAFMDSHELGVITYHAGAEVPRGMVPATELGDMDPLDAWEAELEENIRRADLTWQERSSATAQLMDLRRQQAEKEGRPLPTVASIAVEVRGSSQGTDHRATRQEIVLSKYLDDPEIVKAKSPDEAIKILRRREDKQRNEALAASVGRMSIREKHQAFNEDSEGWIKDVPDHTYDVIITDPPYGMDADTFGDAGGRAAGAHDYTDSAETLARILKWMPGEIFRTAKPAAHAYIFCDFAWFGDVKRAMEASGWKVFRTPLIWHKPTGFRTPWVDMGPQRRYETILYAVKGNKRTVKIGGDVITVPSDDNLGHMAQKPVGLYVELLSRSVIPGSMVLDLFAGSGPVIPAAEALLCLATAVEKDPGAYGLIINRLKELKA